MKNRALMIVFAVVSLFLTGCAGQNMLVSQAGTSTAYKTAQMPQKVQTGTVLTVRKVALINQPASLSKRLGATVGAGLGSVIGNKISSKTWARVATAGLGGLLGAEIGDQAAGTVPAQEIIVVLDSENGSKNSLQGHGRKVAITQSIGDGVVVRPGQKVMVIGGGRVAPLNL